MLPPAYRVRKKALLVFVIATLALCFILYKKMSEVSYEEKETVSLKKMEDWKYFERESRLDLKKPSKSKTFHPPDPLIDASAADHAKQLVKQQKLQDAVDDAEAVKKFKMQRILQRQLRRGLQRSGPMIVKIGNLTVRTVDQSRKHRTWQRALGDVSNFEVNSIGNFPAKFRPEVGNGHLSAVVFDDRLHVNGLFTGAGRESRRVRLSTIIVENITRVFVNDKQVEPLLRRFSMNMADGVFTQTLTGPGVVIEQRLYAHRNYTPLFVHEIDVFSEVATSKPTVVRMQLDWKGVPRMAGSDIVLGEESYPHVHFESFVHRSGSIQDVEDEKGYPGQARAVHMMSTELPPQDLEVNLDSQNKRMKWTFLLSVAMKESVAREYFELGLQMILKGDWLYLTHLDTWHDIWDAGRVQVQTGGKSHFPVNIISAQYFILSSLPWRPHDEFRFAGLSSGGLGHGDGSTDQGFSGHVFWDQDLWVYPSILMLHPRLARLTMLKYRVNRLGQAIMNAKLNGLKGAMFPWESGLAGRELSRNVLNERHQHHVVGAVSLAAVRYVLLANDTNFLQREGGDDLLIETARFWRSRLTKVKTGNTTFQFEIWSATGPDSNHQRVNNSAYTNALAQACLRAPGRVRRFSGGRLTPEMEEMERVAGKIYVPFDRKRRFHPEFDGYKIDSSIRQADAVLLGYPLNFIFDSTERRNDLLVYEKALGNGPGRSWGVHAIGWLELKDEEKAWVAFKQQMMHARAPFKVWSEFSTGGRVNFLAAAGSLLQAVLNGYFGLRLRIDGLYFDTILPPQATNVSVFGLNYLGNSLDLVMTDEVLLLRCSGFDARAPRLETEIFHVTPRPEPISTDSWVKLQRGRGVVRASRDGSRWPKRSWRQRRNIVDDDILQLRKTAIRLASDRQKRIDAWKKHNDELVVQRRKKLRNQRTEMPLEQMVALRLRRKMKPKD